MNSTWIASPQSDASCSIIAEVGQAHDGSLGMAHAFIDAIAKAGGDGVKFQTHIASAESHPDEPWRTAFSYQDETRYDYWKRMEFSLEQWKGLQQHAKERGLLFLSSPFSFEAVELLTQVGLDAWKVPSGEINNFPLLEAMIQTRIPIILSTGMSPLEEIDQTVQFIQERKCPFAVLQCTSLYPTPPECIGLNVIPLFQKRYTCGIGLSDHSGTIFPGLAAATLGIQILEIHVTLSKEMFGPDTSSSICTSELRQLVEGIRLIETIQTNPLNKASLLPQVAPLRKIFMKSIVAKTDLPAGTIITRDHLSLKKPGSGLAPNRIPDLVGLRIRRPLPQNSFISEEDLEKIE